MSNQILCKQVVFSRYHIPNVSFLKMLMLEDHFEVLMSVFVGVTLGGEGRAFSVLPFKVPNDSDDLAKFGSKRMR